MVGGFIVIFANAICSEGAHSMRMSITNVLLFYNRSSFFLAMPWRCPRSSALVQNLVDLGGALGTGGSPCTGSPVLRIALVLGAARASPVLHDLAPCSANLGTVVN